VFPTSLEEVSSATLGIEKHRNSFPLLYFYLEPAERSSALRPRSFGKLRIERAVSKAHRFLSTSTLWKGLSEFKYLAKFPRLRSG
jgi:hypothetical protein